jgi:cobalt/nickel transport system permease protein
VLDHISTRKSQWLSRLIPVLFLLAVLLSAISGLSDTEKTIITGAVFLLSVVLLRITPLGVHVHGGEKHRHKRIKHEHGAWVSIDYFAYASKIRSWNATFKVLLSLATIILCITLSNAHVSLVVILAMAFLVVRIGGLPFRDYISVLTVPLTFILISIVAIVLDFSGHPIGRYCVWLGFTYLYTTPEMLEKGIFLGLKIVASVSALQLMILTTPSTEIISVLRKTHVPRGFADLMNMIYRYIFILLEVFAKMKDSAESRLGYCDFITSCFTFGNIASNMLVLSLKKAGAYYDAMEARCYDGELRFLEDEKKADIRQIIPAAAFVLYLLLLWYLTR